MPKKTFKFDVILEEEDLCDRREEMERIRSIIKRQGRIVIYSIRRMGKTSLVQVCCRKMQEENPKFFYLYVDLNEASSIEDVARRFRAHSELALNAQFPVQKIKTLVNDLISRLKVNISDGIGFSLEKFVIKQPEQYLLQLFQQLAKISQKHEMLIVIGEFQSVAGLRDVQALLRRELQQLSRSSVVLMGSNQRLLYKIFNDKKTPFFSFGEDLELSNIAINDYLPYLNERFAESNLVIGLDAAKHLLDRMNNIPNYINELGAWIVDHFSNLELTEGHIDGAFEDAVSSKQGRYSSALYGYNNNARAFIRGVAKIGRVVSYSGNLMQEATGLSSPELVRVKKDLEDCPLLSMDTENRIFIIDPFLRRFLEMS